MDDADFNRQKDCRHGRMIYNVNDRWVGRMLELYGEFAERECEVFRQVVRPGDTVVDVGANIGTHSLQLAKLVGRAGIVHAFEPQRLVFQTLCANMAINSIECVRCHQQAVGAEVGEVEVPQLDPRRANTFAGLSLDPGEWEAHRSEYAIRPGAAIERVPVTTIDRLGLDRCRLIKIDVEGMELQVLKGADQTIRGSRPYLYVENDREPKMQALQAHLAALGYVWYWHTPPLYNPNNFAGNPENVYENLKTVNMFCVPKEAGVVVKGID